MAEPSPVARSPIAPTPPEAVVAGWAVSGCRSAAALTLTDHSPLAKAAVKASWDGAMGEILGVPFGRAARQSWDVDGTVVGVLLNGVGPGEWLVLAPPGQQGTVEDWLENSAARADELVTIVDVTHGNALVRLTGARSPDLLAKECGLDLADAVAPDAAALRSIVADVAVDLIRDDLGGTRSYLVQCERSSGQYLFDALLDAGREFGAEADGFVPPGI